MMMSAEVEPIYVVSGSLMASVMASNYTMFACTLAVFPIISFVVNMMYLQIIYQREALQMPKMIKKKCFNSPVK